MTRSPRRKYPMPISEDCDAPWLIVGYPEDSAINYEQRREVLLDYVPVFNQVAEGLEANL